MKRSSIRSKLTGRLLIVLVLVALGTHTSLYFYIRGEIIEQFDESLQTEARAIASVWKHDAPVEAEAAILRRDFPQLHFSNPSGDFLRIVRRDDTDVFHISRRGVSALEIPHEALNSKRRAYDILLPDGRAGRGSELLIDATSGMLIKASSSEADFRLVLAEGREELDETLEHFAMSMLLIGSGLLATSILLVITTVSRELRPLGSFSESLRTLDARSLGFRFDSASAVQELLPISERFNELLARLQNAFDRERRFAESIAHELRTPLTELRSMVEVSMRWPPEGEELIAHHAKVLLVTQRMSEMLHRLLALVRHEQHRVTTEIERLDLCSAIRDTWATIAPLAATRGVTLALTLPPRLEVMSDGVILRSLLENLLTNAALYATPDTSIDCRAYTDPDGGVVFSLSNNTPELSPADLAHIEEPFWRKDRARTARDRSGLGLSLVRQYADALSITCQYSMPASDRFTAELRWPCAVTPAMVGSLSSVPDGPLESR